MFYYSLDEIYLNTTDFFHSVCIETYIS